MRQNIDCAIRKLEALVDFLLYAFPCSQARVDDQGESKDERRRNDRRFPRKVVFADAVHERCKKAELRFISTYCLVDGLNSSKAVGIFQDLSRRKHGESKPDSSVLSCS
jgi:hypothetical protein